MLSEPALTEFVNGLWLTVTALMAETNRLKKHVRSQRDYDAVIHEKISPRLAAVNELVTWVCDQTVPDAATQLVTGIQQALTQLAADERRQLDQTELDQRNRDREEGRIARHRRRQ
ncbi:hypothetical protein [Furfurilactobacillus entadae]|uniref:hypothetical protein n=1 Tax=Furfurilactobacillus entadae TaxID=2922307 RepID=UPI0035E54E5C